MNKYLVTVCIPNIETLQNIVFAEDKEEALDKFKNYHMGKINCLYNISFYLDDENYTSVVKIDDIDIIKG